jgi:hypothetical protein
MPIFSPLIAVRQKLRQFTKPSWLMDAKNNKCLAQPALFDPENDL